MRYLEAITIPIVFLFSNYPFSALFTAVAAYYFLHVTI